jgi:hypothetical protein
VSCAASSLPFHLAGEVALLTEPATLADLPHRAVVFSPIAGGLRGLVASLPPDRRGRAPRHANCRANSRVVVPPGCVGLRGRRWHQPIHPAGGRCRPSCSHHAASSLIAEHAAAAVHCFVGSRAKSDADSGLHGRRCDVSPRSSRRPFARSPYPRHDQTSSAGPNQLHRALTTLSEHVA